MRVLSPKITVRTEVKTKAYYDAMCNFMSMIIGGAMIALIFLVGLEIYLHYDNYFPSRIV